jgi:Protein NO VEIN, C-terminal
VASATAWCEVKAMTGRLADRPVGLSRSQFDCAAERGDAYWLYIVEQAATDSARVIRIQNPTGKARTFTFDRGWLDVAAADDAQPDDDQD